MTESVHALGSRLRVTHRAVRASSQPRQQKILGIEEGFCPESTTDVGGDDTNLFGGQSVEGRQLVSNWVRSLTGLPMSQASHAILVGLFPSTGRHPWFERARCDASIQDASFDDHVAGREVHLSLRGQCHHHVAAPFGEEQRRRGHRLFGIHHDGQRVVVHLHTFGGVDGLRAGLGHHRGHQLTDETDGVGRQRAARDVGRQQRHIDRNRSDAIGSQVGRGEDAHHTRHRSRLVDVDGVDSRVCDRRPHVHHVRRSGKRQIVDEGPSTGDEIGVLGAHHPCTDHSHVIPLLSSPSQSPCRSRFGRVHDPSDAVRIRLIASHQRRLPSMTVTESSPAKAERWTAQWKELYNEVITTGLCTGCAGCVVTCPHDVIGYEHEEGKYKPFHLEEELGLDNCVHGEKGCTTCTRACPRFRSWETAADMHLFGRTREPDEMAGVWRQLLLTRASDKVAHEKGQDGGFVSAMLIWLLENDYIEAALVSGVEPDDAWKAKPALARNKEEVLATAGSRYTYCANPLALRDAKEQGFSRLALVGMGCQTSSPPVMWDRKAGKVSKPFLFNIGLLCSKTFDDAIFPELFEAKYGLKKQDMVKMNIKGVFQIWMKDGSYHEIDLKECHKWTREGCKSCPDFAAEHSDIATGGIGKDNDWTLTIVRTELGEEVINRMIKDGVIEARPAQEDEVAMKLLRTLSIVSRRRWPEWADKAPSVGVPPPKKKADGSAPAAH